MELNMTYVIWVMTLMIAGYWLFLIQVRKDFQKKQKLSFISSFLQLLFFVFHASMIYVFIPVTWGHLPPLSEHILIHALSFMCIIAGLIIVAASMIPLGFQRTMGLRSMQLKTSGLYHISRNPQITGYAFVLAGYVISYFSLYSSGWFIIFFINIQWMIHVEEEYLKKMYGDEYEKYCRQVPRFLDVRSFRNIFR
jgi:protein-S-isoprenylcysteine O-methyltransferase Ste14